MGCGGGGGGTAAGGGGGVGGSTLDWRCWRRGRWRDHRVYGNSWRQWRRHSNDQFQRRRGSSCGNGSTVAGNTGAVMWVSPALAAVPDALPPTQARVEREEVTVRVGVARRCWRRT